MAYLLMILTFTALILFYSFYPRTDTVELLDKPMAKTAVAELIAQHSAALQAATVLHKQADGTNKMAYEVWNLTNNVITSTEYQSFMTPGLVPSAEKPVSVRICVNNATGEISNTCGVRTTNTNVSFPKGTTDFIITYLPKKNIDDEYGKYLGGLAVRALGENVYLTNYTEKQHLTTNCGIMEEGTANEFDEYPEYVLSNTRYQTVSVPGAFTRMLGNLGDASYLMCITRVSVAYENDAESLTDFVQINEQQGE